MPSDSALPETMTYIKQDGDGPPEVLVPDQRALPQPAAMTGESLLRPPSGAVQSQDTAAE